jgi:hypothetical protein
MTNPEDCFDKLLENMEEIREYINLRMLYDDDFDKYKDLRVEQFRNLSIRYTMKIIKLIFVKKMDVNEAIEKVLKAPLNKFMYNTFVMNCKSIE